MKRSEFIKYLEEAKRLLVEEVKGLTDYAMEEACYSIEGAIEFVKENEED